MKKMSGIVLALTAAVTMGSAAARADSIWELESARANARAGGPVSAQDAFLLERYGCLSGTRSAFCQSLNRRPHKKYWSRAERGRVAR